MAITITRNQTPTFFATVATSTGSLFDTTDFKSGKYTVYKSSQYMLSSVPAKFLTPVEGFVDAPIPAASIISSEVVSSSNLGYNFRFAPDASEAFPFPDVGIYFVEFQLTPQAGNPIVWQRTVEVV